jgi:hypothetical protein
MATAMQHISASKATEETEMQTNTLRVAEAEYGMLNIRLARNGMAVNYSLTRQDGRTLLGPCANENELEVLAHKYLRREQQRMCLETLACELAVCHV